MDTSPPLRTKDQDIGKTFKLPYRKRHGGRRY